MRAFIKKYGSVLYIALATAIVLVVISRSKDLPDAIKAFGYMETEWVWAALAVMVLYILTRCGLLIYYLRRQGEKIGLFDALVVSGTGHFYSAITPSASGGQPMQVLAMHRRGIPVSTAVATVSVKFIGFQVSLLLMGLICWILNGSMVYGQLGGMLYIVVLGFVLNGVLMAAVILTAGRIALVNRALSWCVRLAARLHFVKDEDATRAKAQKSLEEYRSALWALLTHPLDALMVLLLSLLQVLFLMSVPFCLYRAFALEGWTFGQLLTLQLLLFISAAFVPLPGAAGVQEGGFYLFFLDIFPEGSILAAMLCWRLFTYYLLMIFGLATMIAESLRNWIRGKGRPRDG